MPLGTLCAACVAIPFLLPGTSRAANPVLTGDVGRGDAFIITLKDANNQNVTHLDPGTYTINVNDESTVHNFHLSGPGVDQATQIETTSTAQWTVTFTDGTYTFKCDAHPTQMVGTFTVGTPPPPPPPPTVLKGSVGPGPKISLKKAGVTVKSLKAGKFTVKVRDRSPKLNFHLKGPGVSRKTGIPFVGRKTWKLKFRAGKYVYKSDAGKHLKKTFSVH